MTTNGTIDEELYGLAGPCPAWCTVVRRDHLPGEAIHDRWESQIAGRLVRNHGTSEWPEVGGVQVGLNALEIKGVGVGAVGVDVSGEAVLSPREARLVAQHLVAAAEQAERLTT